MSIVTYAFVRDYRVGIDIALNGVAEPNGKYWMVEYAGSWGFEGDPGPMHREVFPAGKIGPAMERYAQLVKAYHDTMVGVNRLKAFKKAWVRPFDSKRHSDNDEAAVYHAEAMLAVLSSQGDRSRRKRVWPAIVSWLGKGQEGRVDTAMIIPASVAVPGATLEPGSKVVPNAKVSAEITKTWCIVVTVYRASL